jgi:protease IV
VDANYPPDEHSAPVLAAAVAERPAPPPPPPPRRRFGFFSWLLLLLLGGSVLLNLMFLVFLGARGQEGGQVQEKLYRPDEFGRGAEKVAIITVEGVILDGDGFVGKQIDQAKRDENVKAIVLRVNSPGGTISGSDSIYHQLTKLRESTKKPIIVSMGSVAASGGYYVAMAVGSTANTIYAEPSTWTGSIGVIMPHYDLSKMLGQVGIAEDSIASHRLKGMGSLARPMTEEERKIFQALINDGFARFKEIVQSGRPVFKEHPEKLDELATGQVFAAEQALQAGLVDKIGFLEDAIRGAVALGNLDPQNYRVVKYQPEATLADVLFGQNAQGRGLDPAAFLNLATPRAYYLFTWPPAALSGSLP